MSSPPDAEGRSLGETAPSNQLNPGADQKLKPTLTSAVEIPVQLRRRRAASWRCPPLSCGRRDPIDSMGSAVLTPSTFGLDERELRRHANDLVQVYGWTVDEITAVLDIVPARAR